MTQSAFIGQPPFSPDAAAWVAGLSFTFAKLVPFIFGFDARSRGLEMALPFFIIQGREDHVISFDESRAYLREVRAPKKEFVAIEGGHFACFTNPRGFVDALLKHVLPLAKTENSSSGS